jgi:hypothetical protein
MIVALRTRGQAAKVAELTGGAQLPGTPKPDGTAALSWYVDAERGIWCIVWCMRRTNIYLDEQQTAILDRLAAQERVSRAELIRQLLDRVLASSDESLASDLHAIERSFGALRDVDVPVRGPDGRDEHLGRIWGRSS